MSDLEVNTDFFSKGGVIGRMDYFVNCCLKAFGFQLLAVIPIALGASMGGAGVLLGGLVTAALVLPVIYFAIVNTCKRLRDIRGTTENENTWQIIAIVCMYIPFLGIIVVMLLLFMEGAITGNGKGTAGFEQKRSNLNTINESGEQKYSTLNSTSESEEQKILNLEKFYMLKESGVISEEEFVKYKEDTLKKMAS
jgi:uncharacterized membrane protein YhaH (DUF805 family)